MNSKARTFVVFLLLLTIGVVCHGQLLKPLQPMGTSPLPKGVSIIFSSDGGDICGEAAKFIDTAKHEVLISFYAINEPRVVNSLIKAFQRGCVVAVLLDAKPAIRGYNTPNYLRRFGLPVILAQRGNDGKGWHNQHYAVVDRQCVLIASGDLVSPWKNNTDTLVIINESGFASRFFNNFMQEANRGGGFSSPPDPNAQLSN